MTKHKKKAKIDWKSKLIDLLIVIIGITIAFKLNNWNESLKRQTEAKEYIESFFIENNSNRENLVSALEFAKSNKQDIDTLIHLLLSENYSDTRIKPLIGSMMGLADFIPSITTMENISASGEFDLIRDIDLRKNLIKTYNTYKTVAKFEALLSDYVDKYLTPFFMENILFRDFSSLNSNFIKDPLFENIVIGYEVLLNQQINGYENNLEKLDLLNEKLTTTVNTY